MDQLTQVAPVIARAYQLSQTVLTLVRGHWGDQLDAWMTVAAHRGMARLGRFPQSLPRDLAASKAGLPLPWRNGPVEGDINRLKRLKHQGYGRDGFAL